MSLLFEPLRLRSVTFRNRIVVSPMCQYSATDGFVNDWHLVHLGSRAVGGAGLLITEACSVSPEGRISPFDIGIWNDEHIPGLQRITSFIRQQGAVAGIQLAHAGRKASCDRPWNGGQYLGPEAGGWQPVVAPSAIPFKEGSPVPHALTVQEIQAVILDFKKAAKRSLEAGFQVAEIHAAHGYLLHEFLSPLSNHRTDQYGGSPENRARLLLEIIHAVREVWPDTLPLFVRISASDWTTGGLTMEDSVQLANLLKDTAVDLIDCSTGGNVPVASIPVEPGYQVPFAKAIREQTGIKTGAVGLISTARQAEQILQEGSADVIIMARELLRDPYFPLHAAQELGDEITWPSQYLRAKPR